MRPLTPEQELANRINAAIEAYTVACEISHTPLWLSVAIFGIRLVPDGLLNVSIHHVITPDNGINEDLTPKTPNLPFKN